MKTSKPVVIAATFATTLATAIGSSYAAAGSGKHGHDRFPIELSVAEQRAVEKFNALDANGDELISLAEFQAQPAREGKGWKHGRRGGKHGQRHSGKGDNKALTDAQRDERRAARQARKKVFEEELFVAMDLNKDGQLSSTEASRENRKAAKQQVHRSHKFARLDADANGMLTQAEFASRLQRLRTADANGDGEVSRDEARAMRRQGAQQRADG